MSSRISTSQKAILLHEQQIRATQIQLFPSQYWKQDRLQKEQSEEKGNTHLSEFQNRMTLLGIECVEVVEAFFGEEEDQPPKNLNSSNYKNNFAGQNQQERETLKLQKQLLQRQSPISQKATAINPRIPDSNCKNQKFKTNKNYRAQGALSQIAHANDTQILSNEVRMNPQDRQFFLNRNRSEFSPQPINKRSHKNQVKSKQSENKQLDDSIQLPREERQKTLKIIPEPSRSTRNIDQYLSTAKAKNKSRRDVSSQQQLILQERSPPKVKGSQQRPGDSQIVKVSAQNEEMKKILAKERESKREIFQEKELLIKKCNKYESELYILNGRINELEQKLREKEISLKECEREFKIFKELSKEKLVYLQEQVLRIEKPSSVSALGNQNFQLGFQGRNQNINSVIQDKIKTDRYFVEDKTSIADNLLTSISTSGIRLRNSMIDDITTNNSQLRPCKEIQKTLKLLDTTSVFPSKNYNRYETSTLQACFKRSRDARVGYTLQNSPQKNVRVGYTLQNSPQKNSDDIIQRLEKLNNEVQLEILKIKK